MINAKQEIIDEIDLTEILAAMIMYEEKYDSPLQKFRLKVNGDIDTFLSNLDFEYDNRAFQENTLFGTIWLKNGNWYDHEYSPENGVIEWVLRERPEIPEELKGEENENL